MKPAQQNKIILASESPRRKELLQKAGYTFDVIPSKVSEIPNENLNINDQILDVARRKALAILPQLLSSEDTQTLVLSADTEVIFNNKPLGKPQTKEDAFRILRLLSGNAHEVKTAVCLFEVASKKEISQVETTRIFFKNLSDEDIWTYIETGEPMDKAGAYGIQGRGGEFVERYEGSFDNVVGLPIQLVQELMKSFSNK